MQSCNAAPMAVECMKFQGAAGWRSRKGQILIEQEGFPSGSPLFVSRKPLARRVVQKKANADDVDRETPFA